MASEAKKRKPGDVGNDVERQKIGEALCTQTPRHNIIAVSDRQSRHAGEVPCTQTSGRNQDDEYFSSYSHIDIHECMIADKVRTNTYRWAVLKNYELFRGKIVADVGAGTGILSLFAVQAGAKQVYAIEASEMAKQIEAVVAENKMEKKITVIHGRVEEVVLPETVDVVISEWMGYFLLYESMLNSVIYARDRWLKPDGMMMPSAATLYLAPVSDDDYDDKIAFWKEEVKNLYKVSMETIIPVVKKHMAKTVIVKTVQNDSPQSHAQIIKQFDLTTVKESELKSVQKEFSFSCFGQSIVHGFVAWFDVEFPKAIKLTTSPYHEETHWEQCVMYLDEPVDVEQDTVIKGDISISPNQQKPRFLDINLTYQIGENSPHTKYYFMADDLS